MFRHIKAIIHKYCTRIIAEDFDGTLCTRNWPDIGRPNMREIRMLIRHRKRGGRVILWTCREGESLARAVVWCRLHGLTFDAINANLPDQNELYGNDCRKVGADEYRDDKAKRVKYLRGE